MNDLFYLTEYPEILAGFTLAEEDNPVRRERMARELEEKGKTLVWPRQVHSDIVVAIRKEDLRPGQIEIPSIDATVTDLPGVRLISSHADCLPVYMYDPAKHAIGLAHSGWRGCLAGIGVNMLRKMEREYGCNLEDVAVYIGPGIGYCCFEVDRDVMEAFTERYPWAEDEYVLSKGGGKYHIDLKGIVSEYLQMEGIEQISIDPRCTCCGGEAFWSYRRNGTKYRHMAYMELKE